ncbi:MAG: trans-aconitate 2-methyltransferase [Micavibrio sp.]|nr:trans-aconitate 2-methyltransferase [Micavibrio sp.]
MTDTWSAKQYTKFEDERTRPVRDLVARIQNTDVRTAVDVGCGPGNSTEQLLARYPAAKVSGMDSSADMIAAAKKRLPHLQFEVSDLTAWNNTGPFDVILSNAVLQWVPDHKAILQSLIAKLAPGGSLAVQIPANLAEPAQTLMREVANNGPWAQKLKHADAARTDRHDAEWYFRELRGSVTGLDIWKTTYYHPLAGASAIVEWFRGTGLRPFLDPLDDAEKAEFLKRYEAGIAKAHPAMADGTVLLPFPRLFIIATK